MGLNRYFENNNEKQEDLEVIEIKNFLIAILPKVTDNPKEGIEEIRNTLKAYYQEFPQAFEFLGNGISPTILKNNGFGLLVLQKIYQEFYPLCFVKACYEFNPWNLPEEFREFLNWKKMNSHQIKILENTVYQQKISDL